MPGRTPAQFGDPLYHMPSSSQTRWISFENPSGAPGSGGRANRGAKGSAYRPVAAGQTVVLADFEGSGSIRRIWFTLRDRSPVALRSYVLRIFWDGASTPAVEVPFGDFFGAILGVAVPFESELFSNPEGRSFNCMVPMPFRRSLKMTFTNESAQELEQLYYELDLVVGEADVGLSQGFAQLPLDGALGGAVLVGGHPVDDGLDGLGAFVAHDSVLPSTRSRRPHPDDGEPLTPRVPRWVHD